MFKTPEFREPCFDIFGRADELARPTLAATQEELFKLEIQHCKPERVRWLGYKAIYSADDKTRKSVPTLPNQYLTRCEAAKLIMRAGKLYKERNYG